MQKNSLGSDTVLIPFLRFSHMQKNSLHVCLCFQIWSILNFMRSQWILLVGHCWDYSKTCLVLVLLLLQR